MLPSRSPTAAATASIPTRRPPSAKGMTDAQHGELLAVIAMATQTNALATALACPWMKGSWREEYMMTPAEVMALSLRNTRMMSEAGMIVSMRMLGMAGMLAGQSCRKRPAWSRKKLCRRDGWRANGPRRQAMLRGRRRPRRLPKPRSGRCAGPPPPTSSVWRNLAPASPPDRNAPYRRLRCPPRSPARPMPTCMARPPATGAPGRYRPDHRGGA